MLKSLDHITNRCPATEQLLISGGDDRLAIDPISGVNKYACQPFPDPSLLAFGSSTASVISSSGYVVAQHLRQQLLTASQSDSLVNVYQQQLQQFKLEWLEACDLDDFPGLNLIFSASGTDVHRLIAEQLNKDDFKTLVIMVAANETGSGVCSALSNGNKLEVKQVSLRLADGSPRPIAVIDEQVEQWVATAVSAKRRVLLVMVDQSKTGLIAPSPQCVIALKLNYSEQIDVLVDACQFRLHNTTLKAYLQQGFMVALTGSKFLTAPSFSAVLLLPENISSAVLESALAEPNLGLLLRIAVALEELRRFRLMPHIKIISMMQAFTRAIIKQLNNDPNFELLASPALNREGLLATQSWDHLQTIFPFVLYHHRPSGRTPLSLAETLTVYQQKQTGVRWQLGQPVACGARQGIAVSALRLCISSRLLVEAETVDSLINDALITLQLVKQTLQKLG